MQSGKRQEPEYKVQKDSSGYQEPVDITVYKHIVVCQYEGCTEIRYIKPQDLKQVRYCKPHAALLRRQYRAKYMRTARSRG